MSFAASSSSSSSGAIEGIAHIYSSGDVLLNNPVESCIIFVGVILISALLEFILYQIQTRVEGRYVRMVVNIVTQEVTIVGILALILMLATSFLPRDSSQLLYSLLFTLANISLFFMTAGFMFQVIAQYAIGMRDMAFWKRFEEGKMELVDKEQLRFREKHYKLAVDRFAVEIKMAYDLTLRECAFHDNLIVFHKKYLVSFADLSYRTWLSLSVIVLCNFGRSILSDSVLSISHDVTQQQEFYNALLYLACTGWFVLLCHAIFCFMLFSSTSALLNARLPRSTVGADIVPFGHPRRCVEFLQCVLLSLAYYGTLHVTGIGNSVTNAGDSTIVSVLFAIPFVVVFLSIPWCMWTLSVMSVLGSAKKNKEMIRRIVQRAQGNYDDDADSVATESDDLDDSDNEAAAKGGAKKPGQKPAAKSSSLSSPRSRNRSIIGVQSARRGGSTFQKKPTTLLKGGGVKPPTSVVHQRPAWLDDDEPWDSAAGVIGVGAANSNAAGDDAYGGGGLDEPFYENVAIEELRRMVEREAPGLLAREQEVAREYEKDLRERKCRDGKTRPAWLDSDEDLDL